MGFSANAQINIETRAAGQHQEAALVALMSLVKHAAEVHTIKGTNRQKYALMRYWAMFCATYELTIAELGRKPDARGEASRMNIRKES